MHEEPVCVLCTKLNDMDNQTLYCLATVTVGSHNYLQIRGKLGSGTIIRQWMDCRGNVPIHTAVHVMVREKEARFNN